MNMALQWRISPVRGQEIFGKLIIFNYWYKFWCTQKIIITCCSQLSVGQPVYPPVRDAAAVTSKKNKRKVKTNQ
jgi:hypothetical protein